MATIAELEARIEELERKLSSVQGNLRSIRPEQLAGYLSTLTVAGVLSLGTSGGIWQGTGSFAVPTTGLKMWNDAGVGKLAGYNSGALQWAVDTDGRIKAGIIASAAGDISFHNNAPLADTITSTVFDFTTHFSPGESIVIYGASDAGNNAARTVAAVAVNTLTLLEIGVQTNRTNDPHPITFQAAATLDANGITMAPGVPGDTTSRVLWKETAGAFAWLVANSDNAFLRQLLLNLENAATKKGWPTLTLRAAGEDPAAVAPPSEVYLSLIYDSTLQYYLALLTGALRIQGWALLGTTGFLSVTDLNTNHVADAGLIRLPNEQWIMTRNGLDNGNLKVLRTSSDDGLIVGTYGQAADAELENRQFCIWYDEAATTVNIKVKDSLGVVRTASTLAV